MTIDAKNLIAEFDSLKNDRSILDKQLEECADYACSEKADLMRYGLNSNRQQDNNSKPKDIIINEVAEANGVLARGMYTNTCPPALRWFAFSLSDQGETSEEIKEFFSIANEQIYTILMNSNFALQTTEVFEDAGCFGTICMYSEYDDERKVNFRNIHIKNIYCSDDEKGQVNRVFRSFELKACDAIHQFKDDDLPKKIVEHGNSSKHEERNKKYNFLHVVYKNRNRKYNKNAEVIDTPDNKKFNSYYLNIDEKKLISSGGYDYMPYTVARFEKKSNEVYGISPTMRSLRTAKILNKLTVKILRQVDKVIDPPVALSASSTADYDTFFFNNPGDTTLVDPTANAPVFQQIPINFPVGYEEKQELKKSINKQFFVDIFQMIQQLNENQGRQRTAFEIQQLIGEKNSMIIPVVARLLEEFLTPVLKNVWQICVEHGVFGDLAKSLDIRLEDTKINFISPLALATQQTEVNNFYSVLQQIGQLAQIDPSVTDYIDIDKATVKIIKQSSVHTDFVRSQAEVNKIRTARAEAAQAQQQAEMSAELAKSQNLTAPVDENSIANNMMEGMLGG